MTTSIRTTLLAALVAAVPLGLVGPAPAASATGSGVAGPLAAPEAFDRSDLHAAGFGSTGGSYRAMYGVVAIAPDDALSVGTGGSALGVRSRRWDGTSWVSTHPPGGPVCELWSVAAITPTDAWAVGDKFDLAFTVHWDGASWTKVATPEPQPAQGDYLLSVDGASSDDVWAVGVSLVDESYDRYPLIEHWDGVSWTKIPYDLPYGNTFGDLRGITVIATDDAWAVGTTSGHRSAPLLLHWDGDTWTPVTDIITTTSDGYISVLTAVDAVSTDDVWAVGDGGGFGGTATVHWDGQRWKVVSSPSRDVLIDELHGVTAVAADDVWAVGGYGQSYSAHTQILHWDGERWHRVHSPDPGSAKNELWAVSASGPNDAWAVGIFTGPRGAANLYLHWDGTSWTRVHAGGQPS